MAQTLQAARRTASHYAPSILSVARPRAQSPQSSRKRRANAVRRLLESDADDDDEDGDDEAEQQNDDEEESEQEEGNEGSPTSTTSGRYSDDGQDDKEEEEEDAAEEWGGGFTAADEEQALWATMPPYTTAWCQAALRAIVRSRCHEEGERARASAVQQGLRYQLNAANRGLTRAQQALHVLRSSQPPCTTAEWFGALREIKLVRCHEEEGRVIAKAAARNMRTQLAAANRGLTRAQEERQRAKDDRDMAIDRVQEEKAAADLARDDHEAALRARMLLVRDLCAATEQEMAEAVAAHEEAAEDADAALEQERAAREDDQAQHADELEAVKQTARADKAQTDGVRDLLTRQLMTARTEHRAAARVAALLLEQERNARATDAAQHASLAARVAELEDQLLLAAARLQEAGVAHAADDVQEEQ